MYAWMPSNEWTNEGRYKHIDNKKHIKSTIVVYDDM